MSKGVGRIIQFGVAKETTRGTSPAAATFYIPWSEFDIQEKFEDVVDEQSRGIIEGSVGESRTKDWAEGKFTAPIGDKHFGLVLYAALGGLSTSGPTDSAYSHTITVGQSAQHQSLSLYIDDPLGGQDYTHALAMIDQLDIKYEMKKFLEYTATVKAKKGATASLSPSATTENRFLPQHLTFGYASAYSGLGSATAVVLKSLQLTIKKNLESDDVLGATAPADFLNKQFEIEGTLEALWQNESDFKTISLAGTTKAVRIDVVNSDVLIGATSRPQFRIDLAKVVFTEISRVTTLKDLVKQTLKFKAHYSTSDSLMISALIKNAQASY